MLRLAVFVLLLTGAAHAQTAVFSGTAVDAETGTPLPGATAFLLGGAGGTSAADDGTFRLALPDLPATVVVRFVGYATAQTEVTLPDVQGGVARRTVRLTPEPATFGEAVITTEPPGERLWRRVLARRQALAARVGVYSAEVYTRLTLLRAGRFDVGQHPVQLTETLSNVSWSVRGGPREEVVARRRLPAGGPFRWAAPGPLPDLYLDDVLSLDGQRIPSPFAPDALTHYAFRIGETRDADGQRRLDVAVIPRRGGLVAGRIQLVDTLFVVAEAELRLDGPRPSGADLFDATYRWTYAPIYADDALRDSLWLPAAFTREGTVTVNLPGYRVPTVRFRQQSVPTLAVPGATGEAVRFGRRYGSTAGVYAGREVYSLGRAALPLDSLERTLDTDARFRRARLAELLPAQEGLQFGGLLGLLGAAPSIEGVDD
ncbi:MAG TPA: carboxypeptidase-like regulatory domain-containing protein [Rubricoccaceae bacterium]